MTQENQPATKKDIAGLEAKIGSLDTRIGSLDTKVGSLDAKIDAAAKRLDAKIDATAERLDAKIGATAARLDQKIDRVALELAKAQGQMESMEGRLGARMDANSSRVLSAIDQFTAVAKHYEQADATRGQTLIDVEVRWLDHERRLAALESSPPQPRTP